MKSKRLLMKAKQKKSLLQKYEKQTGVPLALRIKNIEET